MIKRMRYTIGNAMFGDKELLKAIAFMLLSYHITKSNVVKKFNIKKISNITGVHFQTAKKRIKTIIEKKLARIENDNLIFSSIVSKHKERNISLEKINYNSLHDIEKSLYGVLVVMIQSRKDYCRSTIQRATDGKSFKDIKRAKLILRRCNYGTKYNEYGLSYHRIAVFLGISLKSAFSYVKYAIKQGMITMKRNFQRLYMPNVNYRDIEGFTFTTKDYGYIIGANIYSIINSRATHTHV